MGSVSHVQSEPDQRVAATQIQTRYRGLAGRQATRRKIQEQLDAAAEEERLAMLAAEKAAAGGKGTAAASAAHPFSRCPSRRYLADDENAGEEEGEEAEERPRPASAAP